MEGSLFNLHCAETLSSVRSLVLDTRRGLTNCSALLSLGVRAPWCAFTERWWPFGGARRSLRCGLLAATSLQLDCLLSFALRHWVLGGGSLRFRRLLKLPHLHIPALSSMSLFPSWCGGGEHLWSVSSNLSHFTRMASKFFRSAASLRRFSPVITSEAPESWQGSEFRAYRSRFSLGFDRPLSKVFQKQSMDGFDDLFASFLRIFIDISRDILILTPLFCSLTPMWTPSNALLAGELLHMHGL